MPNKWCSFCLWLTSNQAAVIFLVCVLTLFSLPVWIGVIPTVFYLMAWAQVIAWYYLGITQEEVFPKAMTLQSVERCTNAGIALHPLFLILGYRLYRVEYTAIEFGFPTSEGYSGKVILHSVLVIGRRLEQVCLETTISTMSIGSRGVYLHMDWERRRQRTGAERYGKTRRAYSEVR